MEVKTIFLVVVSYDGTSKMAVRNICGRKCDDDYGSGFRNGSMMDVVMVGRMMVSVVFGG